MKIQVLDSSFIEVENHNLKNLQSVICEKLGISTQEFKAKYLMLITNPRQTFINDAGKAFIRIQAFFYGRRRLEGIVRTETVDVHPTEIGMSKQAEILVGVKEENVINLKTRKTECGYFIFPVRVKIPSILEWKYRWLYTFRGTIVMSRLLARAKNDNSGIFTARISPNMIKDRKFSDFHKQFPKRKRVSKIQLNEMLRKGLIFYVFTEDGGNIPIGV